MQHYYLDFYIGGRTLRDEEGSAYDDAEGARQEAHDVLGAMTAVKSATDAATTFGCVIRDEVGRPIYRAEATLAGRWLATETVAGWGRDDGASARPAPREAEVALRGWLARRIDQLHASSRIQPTDKPGLARWRWMNRARAQRIREGYTRLRALEQERET